MPFLPNAIIASSWKIVVEQRLENKLLGLFHVLKSLNADYTLLPSHQYTFSARQLAESLEHCFYFDTDIKMNTSLKENWILFSKNWEQEVLKIFLKNKTVNVLDIAIINLNNYNWAKKTITYRELITEFYNQFKINESARQLWFIEPSDLDTIIDLDDTQNRQHLKQNILAKFPDIIVQQDNNTIGIEDKLILAARPGELTRAPFYQTLYANQTTQQCFIIVAFDFMIHYNLTNPIATSLHHPSLNANKIYFGCPGTGKSYKIGALLEKIPKKQWERVTFHPEFDYSNFVGAFKPITVKNEDNTDSIKYKFVPQIFTKIYVNAWKNPNDVYYLIIEEINRGNCAEIFGDTFQILEKEYSITPSFELESHLIEQLGKEHEGIREGLKLPPNLTLLATMNTSDQSLFPMDSAFKRRWEWEYVPINYEQASAYTLVIDDKKYNWGDFLQKINAKIYEITDSEDKQMGTFFVKPDAENQILLEPFAHKVLFYLWFDIFKYEDKNSNSYIFKTDANLLFSYADLFLQNGIDTNKIQAFLNYNNIQSIGE